MKKESAEYGVDVTNEATAPVKGVALAQPVVRGDETITYVEIGDAIRLTARTVAVRRAQYENGYPGDAVCACDVSTPEGKRDQIACDV